MASTEVQKKTSDPSFHTLIVSTTILSHQDWEWHIKFKAFCNSSARDGNPPLLIGEFETNLNAMINLNQLEYKLRNAKNKAVGIVTFAPPQIYVNTTPGVIKNPAPRLFEDANTGCMLRIQITGHELPKEGLVAKGYIFLVPWHFI